MRGGSYGRDDDAALGLCRRDRRSRAAVYSPPWASAGNSKSSAAPAPPAQLVLHHRRALGRDQLDHGRRSVGAGQRARAFKSQVLNQIVSPGW